MKKVICVAIAATIALGACAKSPSSIAPMAVASAEYQGLSCSQLNTEYTTVTAKLADAVDRQNKAQTADAVGVFLVLIPISAMTGDAEAEVAQYKGEKIAIERSLEKRGC